MKLNNKQKYVIYIVLVIMILVILFVYEFLKDSDRKHKLINNFRL